MKRSRLTAVAAVLVLMLVTVALVSAATYIVQPGDTLWRISRQFGTTVDAIVQACLLYTSPSPRDRTRSRMPSSA